MVWQGILVAFVFNAKLSEAFWPAKEIAMFSNKTVACEMMNLLFWNTVKPLMFPQNI